MRRRRYHRSYGDGPGGLQQLGRLVGIALVLLAVGAGALAYYGSTVSPQSRKVEKVLPDERFPR